MPSQSAKDTLFQTKLATKTTPFGAAHPYVAYTREYPLSKSFLKLLCVLFF